MAGCVPDGVVVVVVVVVAGGVPVVVVVVVVSSLGVESFIWSDDACVVIISWLYFLCVCVCVCLL